MYDLSSIIDNETLRRFYPIRPPKGFPTISSKGDTADQPWGKFNHSHPRTICAYSRVKKVSLAEHFKQRHSSLLTRQPSNIHFISALVLCFFFFANGSFIAFLLCVLPQGFSYASTTRDNSPFTFTEKVDIFHHQPHSLSYFSSLFFPSTLPTVPFIACFYGKEILSKHHSYSLFEIVCLYIHQNKTHK